MESQVVKLKSDFNNLINIRNNVKNIFDILQSRIDKLKLFYSEFIQSNQNQTFVFGLDSFHFQSKLIDIEYDDMKRLFMAINNRMYCEYFKLNKIIIDYILTNIKEKKVTESLKINNFPIYKDLEPYKEYKFEILMEIHGNILKNINILISELNSKENEIKIHKTKQQIGLNIDNFVTTFNFNNNIMKEKIIMFITYVEFFHKLHNKYLRRFSNKIHLIYRDINNDIKFDESIEINTTFESDSYTMFSKQNNSVNSIQSSLSSYLDNISVESDSVKNENCENISNKSNDLNEMNNHLSDDNVDGLFLNLEVSFNSMINNNLIEAKDEEIKFNQPLESFLKTIDVSDNTIDSNIKKPHKSKKKKGSKNKVK